MRTAAETQVRRPSAVRVLTTLLATTAAATVVVELLNWWYAPEQGFGLAVRTGWAMLRSFGFLLLIGHVRRGRTVARPFGLILAVTTIFAVGRLIVPRQGVPPLPGLLGFAMLTALCVAVVWLLYRSPAVAGHLVRHRPRLVIDRDGISWRETPPRRPQASAWLLTSRVAAFTYSPLMLVPALVAGGAILDGRLTAVPAVLFWFGAGHRGQLRGAVLHRVPDARQGLGAWPAGRRHRGRARRRPAAVLVAARRGRPGPRRRPPGRRRRADPLRPAPRRPRPDAAQPEPPP